MASRHGRIVLATGSLELGGTETQLVRLANELNARGYPVTVLVVYGPSPIADRLSEHVELWELQGRRKRGRLARALRLPLAVIGLLRRRPWVVHAFLIHAYGPLIPLAWLARVPVRIIGIRNMRSPKEWFAPTRLLHTVAMRLATGVTANSRAGARAVERPDAVVTPNGVDVPPTQADPVAEPPRGIVVANLIPYKGHADLITALTGLAEPPRIDCFGAGDRSDELAAAAADAGLSDVLRFPGPTTDPTGEYLSAQFAVLPSHEEGMPNAVLEAQAAGLPVIATAVGGIPEIITDGETGLLVPARDPRRLAEAIQELAGNPELRARLGAAARARISAEHVWDRCVDRHIAVYTGASQKG